MIDRLLTPGKLNLGLEVIRRRPDGYHDLATIFQAIDICDELTFTGADTFQYRGPANVPELLDIARPIFERAAKSQRWTGILNWNKAIPVSAGLGGGSSDAALALRLEHVGNQPDISEAAAIGADVPFLLSGGTALARGIGSELTPLPTPDLWFVVHVPDIQIPDKTRTLFGGLEAEDFTDGSEIDAIARSVILGTLPDSLPNAFQRQMHRFEGFSAAWERLEEIAGVAALSGAGPSVFSWHAEAHEAKNVAGEMQSGASGRTFVCRALGAHDDELELRAFRRLLTGAGAIGDCI
ncbi:MAG: hypothetical protein R2849_02285 [Thermomicrobiales bacterium]